MKNIKIIFILFYLHSTIIISQVTNEGLPSSWFLVSDDLSIVEANILPSFDLQAIKDEDKTNEIYEIIWFRTFNSKRE